LDTDTYTYTYLAIIHASNGMPDPTPATPDTRARTTRRIAAMLGIA